MLLAYALILATGLQLSDDDQLVYSNPEADVLAIWRGPGCGSITIVFASGNALEGLSFSDPVGSLAAALGDEIDAAGLMLLDARDAACIAEVRAGMADGSLSEDVVDTRYEYGRWASIALPEVDDVPFNISGCETSAAFENTWCSWATNKSCVPFTSGTLNYSWQGGGYWWMHNTSCNISTTSGKNIIMRNEWRAWGCGFCSWTTDSITLEIGESADMITSTWPILQDVKIRVFRATGVSTATYRWAAGAW